MVPRARSAHRPERTITPRPPAPRGGGSPRTVARVARSTCQPNRTRDSPLRPMGVRAGQRPTVRHEAGRTAWDVVLCAPPGRLVFCGALRTTTRFWARRLGRGSVCAVWDVVVCAAFGTWLSARRSGQHGSVRAVGGLVVCARGAVRPERVTTGATSPATRSRPGGTKPSTRDDVLYARRAGCPGWRVLLTSDRRRSRFQCWSRLLALRGPTSGAPARAPGP